MKSSQNHREFVSAAQRIVKNIARRLYELLHMSCVQIWDATTGECLVTTEKHDQFVSYCRFSRDDDLVYASSGTSIQVNNENTNWIFCHKPNFAYNQGSSEALSPVVSCSYCNLKFLTPLKKSKMARVPYMLSYCCLYLKEISPHNSHTPGKSAPLLSYEHSIIRPSLFLYMSIPFLDNVIDLKSPLFQAFSFPVVYHEDLYFLMIIILCISLDME